MNRNGLPLSDIKVIDLTLARAGPTAVRQFADWGADVIRIEPPQRVDEMTGSRYSPDFQNLHRNKRCMAINLKDKEGLEIFFKLAKTADIIVENFRAGVKHRLGIDYDSVRAVNPRIIYGSISGFGQDGPYHARAGVDQIAQGMGGLMSITGLEGQGPVRVGVPISDLAAGMYLAIGMLVALHERERSGEGQWVHTSLLESQIAMLDFQAARWLIDQDVPPQAGNDHPTATPMGLYPTSDGHINLAASGNKKFRIFCELLGAPELADRSDYSSPGRRTKHRAALNAELGPLTKKKTSAEWIEILNEVGIPCGPVNTIDQTFEDPQVKHLGIVQPVEHGKLGTLNLVGQAVHLTRTPTRVRTATAEKGQHTDEVLAEIGYDADQVAGLRERHVI